MAEPLKYVPDAENEVHDLAEFSDYGRARITPLLTLPEEVAKSIVEALAGVVAEGHAEAINRVPNDQQITRAQMFEEGAVFLTSPPFDGFEADRYLMDFYDTVEEEMCSRMHMHTGMRFVRMMTGPSTSIRVSTLAPPVLQNGSASTAPELEMFDDVLVDVNAPERKRYNVIVPPCCWVDMQIPRGTSHQFNASGPFAVIDTVHPEESIEVLRESASHISMMSQTIFLQEEHPSPEDCRVPPSATES